MSCYCGEKVNFKECCQPIINGDRVAQTPNELMRSRYSAYATKNACYIFATYASSQQANNQVTDIKAWAEETTWLSLTVHTASELTIEQASENSIETVQFTATYINAHAIYSMTELSRFLIENNQWRYLDGEVNAHKKIRKIKSNEPCPCLSGKKYKRCCALL